MSITHPFTQLQKLNAVNPYKLRKDLLCSKTVPVWLSGFFIRQLYLAFTKTHVVNSLSFTWCLLFCLNIFLQQQPNHLPPLHCVNLIINLHNFLVWCKREQRSCTVHQQFPLWKCSVLVNTACIGCWLLSQHPNWTVWVIWCILVSSSFNWVHEFMGI